MQLRFAPLCVAALTACLDPTEFVVTITTDAPCPLMGINIVLTRPDDTTTVAPSAVTQQCTGGRVGSIVVLPNPQRGDTVLRVVAGIGESPDACEKDGYTGGCIVERRLMRFVNHSKLQLDVSLRLDCLNIPCDVKSTCVNGRCMPIDASSDGGPGTLPTIAGCDMQGLQQNAPMPMSGYCPANAHRTPFVGPHAVPRVLWRRAIQALPEHPVLVAADGTLYAASQDTFTAIYPDGTVRWSVQLLGAGYGAIAKDGTIVVSSGGDVMTMEPTNGKATKIYGGGASLRRPIAIVGDGAIVFHDDTTIYWITQSGAMLSKYTPPNGTLPFTTVPSGPDGMTFFSASDGQNGFMYGMKRGGQPWSMNVVGVKGSDQVALAPDGSIRFQSDSTTSLYAFAAGGMLKWQKPSGYEPNDIAIAADGTTYFGIQPNDDLHAWDANGNEKWPTPPDGVGTPTIDPSGILFFGRGQQDTHLVALDPNAKIVWELDVGDAIDEAPSIASGSVIYVPGASGNIIAVGP